MEVTHLCISNTANVTSLLAHSRCSPPPPTTSPPCPSDPTTLSCRPNAKDAKCTVGKKKKKKVENNFACDSLITAFLFFLFWGFCNSAEYRCAIKFSMWRAQPVSQKEKEINGKSSTGCLIFNGKR